MIHVDCGVRKQHSQVKRNDHPTKQTLNHIERELNEKLRSPALEP